MIAHGQDIGTGRHGGYAQVARYPADSLVKLTGLTAAEAAAIGTAGFTAAMSVNAIRAPRGQHPPTGRCWYRCHRLASASVSVDLLAGLGYEVVASTGKAEAHDCCGLRRCRGHRPGARPEDKVRPLGKSTWAAVVDSVGGEPWRTR